MRMWGSMGAGNQWGMVLNLEVTDGMGLMPRWREEPQVGQKVTASLVMDGWGKRSR